MRERIIPDILVFWLFFWAARDFSGVAVVVLIIFFDQKTFSCFKTRQFRGRLKKPIRKKTFIYMGTLIGFLGLFLVLRIFLLQIFEGEKFTARSERNSFKKENIIPLI